MLLKGQAHDNSIACVLLIRSQGTCLSFYFIRVHCSRFSSKHACWVFKQSAKQFSWREELRVIDLIRCRGRRAAEVSNRNCSRCLSSERTKVRRTVSHITAAGLRSRYRGGRGDLGLKLRRLAANSPALVRRVACRSIFLRETVSWCIIDAFLFGQTPPNWKINLY